MILLPLLLVAQLWTTGVSNPAVRTGLYDSGVAQPAVARRSTGVTSVTLTALPYTRTTDVGTGSITLTGTVAAGTGALTWSASPKGSTGSCTVSAPSFTCVVPIAPTSTAEAIETITVADKTVTVGYYVTPTHAWHGQSTDNSYNSTRVVGDAIASWAATVGGRSIDQISSTVQPSFRLRKALADVPLVQFDGGDKVATASSAWAFLHDGNSWTVDSTALTNNTVAGNQVFVTTSTSATSCAAAVKGMCLRRQDTNAASVSISSNAAVLVTATAATSAWLPHFLRNAQAVFADDGGAGVDMTLTTETTAVTGLRSGTFTANDGGSLIVGGSAGTNQYLTGDVMRVFVYNTALTSTQQDINRTVDLWLAQSDSVNIPVPAWRWVASSVSAGAVSSWAGSNDGTTTGATLTQATGTAQPTASGSGATAKITCDGTTDVMAVAAGDFTTWSTMSSTVSVSGHIFVVFNPVTTPGTNDTTSYENNDVIWGGTGAPYSPLLYLRSGGGTPKVGRAGNDGNRDVVEANITVGSWAIVDSYHDGTNISIGVNGGTPATTASGSQNNPGAGYRICQSPTSGSGFANIDIAEIRAYPRKLTDAERAVVVADLQATWDHI